MGNNSIFLTIKAAFVAITVFLGSEMGWLGKVIFVWVLCMAIDWLSGSAAAAAHGKWSSATARAGIWHKIGMVLVVAVAGMTDFILGVAVEHIPGLGVQYSVLVLPVILVWYIFTELGSIAENATEMGAPVPTWITKMLAAGKKMAENQIDISDDTGTENKKNE